MPCGEFLYVWVRKSASCLYTFGAPTLYQQYTNKWRQHPLGVKKRVSSRDFGPESSGNISFRIRLLWLVLLVTMRRWKLKHGEALSAASLLGLSVLIAQSIEVGSSKLRMWPEKNHFVIGNEPASGQTAVQLGESFTSFRGHTVQVPHQWVSWKK